MDVVRRDLTAEAMFMARLVTELLPEEPEALGLLALMLHAEARRAARRSAEGEFVPLAAQDPALWDARMIDEAEALLHRAGTRGVVGRYQLEAALQSAHVHRCRTGEANWAKWLRSTMRCSRFRDRRWWRSIARWRSRSCGGLVPGLDALPEPSSDARLAEYQPYWAARAELLARTDARDEAWDAYEMAIGLERDGAVRRFLQQRQGGRGMRGPLFGTPISLLANVVVIWKIGQNQAADFERIDLALLLIDDRTIDPDQDGEGHSSVPFGIEGGHLVVV